MSTITADANAVSWDNYDKGQAPAAARPFPSKGLYLFQIPTTLDDSIFSKGDDGQLVALIDPLIMLGGEYAGYTMRFNRISNKRYGNRNACSMGDFLLAAGSPFRPTTEDQWKQAVLATAGQTMQVFCDWDAWDKVAKKELAKTEDAFPMDANGHRQRFFEVPDPTAPQGKRRVWANLKAKYYKAV